MTTNKCEMCPTEGCDLEVDDESMLMETLAYLTDLDTFAREDFYRELKQNGLLEEARRALNE